MTPFAIKGLPLLLTGYGTRAAKSGDPLKYFFRRADKGIVNASLLAQRTTLATLGNMEARLRQGFVPDATAAPAAVMDALMGHVPTLAGGALHDARNAPGLLNNVITNRVLRKTINDNGTFNITGVESTLKRAKMLHEVAEGVRSLPLAPIGASGGALLGYATGDDDHKLRSTLKGGLTGGLLGFGLQSKLNSLSHDSVYKMIPDVHDEYFATPYWRSQLEHANNWKHQKVGKHLAELLTDLPEKRLARMKTSDASLALNDDILNMDKWKDFVNKAKVSFQSPDAIRKAYNLPTPSFRPRGNRITERLSDRLFGQQD